MPRVLDRRVFLGALAALPLGSATVSAQDSASRSGPKMPKIKLSCNIYLVQRAASRAKTMTLEESLDVCAELGFDAVDPTGYYFPGYPEAPPDPTSTRSRSAPSAWASTSAAPASATTSPRPIGRSERPTCPGQALGDVAAKLGAPMVRVFAGRGVPEGHTKAETTGWVVEHIRDCVAYGAEHGIAIVLQPTTTYSRPRRRPWPCTNGSAPTGSA